MTTKEKKWFLSLDEDIKLKLLQDMLEDEKIEMAFNTIKILLDTPVTEGGVSTEKIQITFECYNNLN
jgi:hypothetical protein